MIEKYLLTAIILKTRLHSEKKNLTKYWNPTFN